MIRVAITDELEINKSDLSILKELNYDIVRFSDDTMETVDVADVWVGNIPEQLPQDLKFVQLLSAGFEHLDVSQLKEQGILLANGRGITSQAISEYCLGAILSLYRGFPQFAKNQEKREWIRNYELKSLVGKNVVIMGTGNIAEHILKLLSPFDCNVYGINSNGRDVPGFRKCYSLDNRQDILGEADIVIMTLPYNKHTHHSISHEEIKMMKDDAILINIGRGGCVNMDAVIELLDNHLGNVVFDVFDEEPLPNDHPLWSHPKAIITPHNSFYSDNLRRNQVNIVMNNLVKYAKDEDLDNLV